MSELFHIKSTRTTPEVYFDPKEKEVHIKGVSIPENAWDFYRPLFEWIDSNFNEGIEQLDLHFRLDYFNTVSARCIVETCQRFIRLSKNKEHVKIFWYYENDDIDMMESGVELSRVLNHPFKIESYTPFGKTEQN
ncbi:MAG: hypothetical protein FD123_2026 [Bacteroidetes bacterium]|nr:MAG: hypothetical protein FD123_2026 [Bacteroidota bacterium]